MNARHDALLADMLCTLRRSLHQVPEQAHQEARTAATVAEFLEHYDPDQLVCEIGGHGLAAVFDTGVEGPTVLVRCELDALRCAEAGSLHRGADHRCGHDGHMAIVSGLAPLLRAMPPARGRVVLLYQPAEETGEGARAVIDDPRFGSIAPDTAMALHNLPNVPRGTVVLREGTFACASVGVILRLEGVAGHAAEPRLASSPRAALVQLLQELVCLDRTDDEGFRMLTVTHAQLGTPSFGITPGDAVLYCTMRATTEADLENLKSEALEVARRAVRANGLELHVEWRDAFPATVSDRRLVRGVAQAAAELGMPVQYATHPLRWSEDFGHFAGVCPSVYFGLGIGDRPPLHHPEYAFDDSQILGASQLFHRVACALVDRGLPSVAA